MIKIIDWEEIERGYNNKMDKTKAIEVLRDLKDYVNENWDEVDYRKDIDEANEAIDIACAALFEGKVVGELSIEGKKYAISELENMGSNE